MRETEESALLSKIPPTFWFCSDFSAINFFKEYIDFEDLILWGFLFWIQCSVRKCDKKKITKATKEMSKEITSSFKFVSRLNSGFPLTNKMLWLTITKHPWASREGSSLQAWPCMVITWRSAQKLAWITPPKVLPFPPFPLPLSGGAHRPANLPFLPGIPDTVSCWDRLAWEEVENCVRNTVVTGYYSWSFRFYLIVVRTQHGVLPSKQIFLSFFFF